MDMNLPHVLDDAELMFFYFCPYKPSWQQVYELVSVLGVFFEMGHTEMIGLRCIH